MDRAIIEGLVNGYPGSMPAAASGTPGGLPAGAAADAGAVGGMPGGQGAASTSAGASADSPTSTLGGTLTAPASSAPASHPAAMGAMAAAPMLPADFAAAMQQEFAYRDEVTRICTASGCAELIAPALAKRQSVGDVALQVLEVANARRDGTSGLPQSAVTGPASANAGAAAAGVTLDVLSAAVVTRHWGRDDAAKAFGSDAVQSVDRTFGYGGIGYRDACRHIARANGYQGDWENPQHYIGRVVPSAMEYGHMPQASVSTLSLPALLDHISTRVMVARVGQVDDAWKGVAFVDSVNDFRLHERLRLAADSQYKPLARDGRIETAVVSDASQTYRITRYALRFAITEPDIVDDAEFGVLGQFRSLLEEMGYATINNRFWDFWKKQDEVFTEKRGNRAKGMELNVDTLEVGLAKYQQRMVLDDKGKPTTRRLGLVPTTLLVGPDLSVRARNIMDMRERRMKTEEGEMVLGNPFGALTLVVAPQIEGKSWWLTNGPKATHPLIHNTFFKGLTAPTIRTVPGLMAMDDVAIHVRGHIDNGPNWGNADAGMRFDPDAA